MTNLINGVLPAPKQIRFVNNQGQPPSKRRRINAACLTCRKRKTRCAGEKPICTTCAKNGHQCLGYGDAVEKKRESPNGPMKFEPADFGNESEFLDDDEEDDRRHWKGKPAGRTAGFVEQDASSRHDSSTSVTPPSGPPLQQSSEWKQEDQHHTAGKANLRTGNYGRNSSYSEDGRSSNNRSPAQHRAESHRMPYFRYFGPTAILPGYKQMVVNVVHRDRRRSRGNSFSAMPSTSLFGHGVPHSRLSHPETILETLDDLPVYDTNDAAPTPLLIITLIKAFFLHLGCNYPFLREERFLRLLKEKRVEPILVDAMCALAARFSDLPIFTNDHDGRVARSEYGHIFAQRAKSATVETFPCPSVQAVQACLLMAYEGFGENQDSALWMYLGLAIRMAMDLGLQKSVGIKYQGHRDPWYTRNWKGKGNHDADSSDGNDDNDEALSEEEQKEVEQERSDTFWAVFVLDRLISSGTGRPVTFRDDDYDLPLPSPAKDPVTGLADPLPAFTEIIHLYGRVSDVLNNIRHANELTEEKMAKLAQMESDLTQIYQKQDENLHFNAVNFREYVQAGQGTTFILFHFWFHAIIVVLHQPGLLTFGSLSSIKLAANSRELAMSSAKTIADILAFAELIDPKSFIGNPFTSQPMYIAACAFLLQSVGNTSEPPSRETTPTDNKAELHQSHGAKGSSSHEARAKHSLLASVANQNYQRCYNSLQQLEQYWGGVEYILTVLKQKSEGIWDCETFTNEDYERAMLARRGSIGRFPRFENPASPNAPPIAWSLTGTTNSPNSNLTLLYQGGHTTAQGGLAPHPSHIHPSSTHTSSHSHSVPVSAPTPPGNMIYDPIRQTDTSAMFPPAYPQPNVSAVRHQAYPPKGNRVSVSMGMGKKDIKYEAASPEDMESSSSTNERMYTYGGMSQSGYGPPPQPPLHTPSSQHPSASEVSTARTSSPASSFADSTMGHHHSSHYHNHGHQSQDHGHNHNTNSNSHQSNSGNSNHSGNYEADFAQSGLVSGSYQYLSGNTLHELIMLDGQEVNIDALNSLGLPTEIMMPAPWLEILPEDVLGLFPSGHNHHM